jgi:hypothetical protein
MKGRLFPRNSAVWTFCSGAVAMLLTNASWTALLSSVMSSRRPAWRSDTAKIPCSTSSPCVSSPATYVLYWAQMLCWLARVRYPLLRTAVIVAPAAVCRRVDSDVLGAARMQSAVGIEPDDVVWGNALEAEHIDGLARVPAGEGIAAVNGRTDGLNGAVLRAPDLPARRNRQRGQPGGYFFWADEREVGDVAADHIDN